MYWVWRVILQGSLHEGFKMFQHVSTLSNLSKGHVSLLVITIYDRSTLFNTTNIWNHKPTTIPNPCNMSVDVILPTSKTLIASEISTFVQSEGFLFYFFRVLPSGKEANQSDLESRPLLNHQNCRFLVQTLCLGTFGAWPRAAWVSHRSSPVSLVEIRQTHLGRGLQGLDFLVFQSRQWIIQQCWFLSWLQSFSCTKRLFFKWQKLGITRCNMG